MSAVPNPKSAAAKAVDSNADNINPAEAARRAKLAEQAKYTDVKRTSSASFKPPMSKDQIVKPPIQPPPKDSSWFHPFSYIKTMFGSKSVANATATGANPNIMDKSNKSEQLNNVTSKNANAGKYNKYIRDPEPETRSNALGTEGREGNPSARLTHSNDVVTPRPKSPSFSVSPKDAITRRDVKRPYGSGLFDHDDDENSNIPKYKPIQSVDNQSTYLHAPDKKGTTSFRITTVPKVGLKQVPTLLSPSFSSQTQHKRPVKMNRKGSTSPHKKGSDIGSARLRSKSTPDSSTLKPRPVSVAAIPKSISLKHTSQKIVSSNNSEVKEVGPMINNAKTLPKPSFSFNANKLRERISMSHPRNKLKMQKSPITINHTSTNAFAATKTSASEEDSSYDSVQNTSCSNSTLHNKVEPVGAPPKLANNKSIVYRKHAASKIIESPTFLIPSMPRQPRDGKSVIERYQDSMLVRKSKMRSKSQSSLDSTFPMPSEPLTVLSAVQKQSIERIRKPPPVRSPSQRKFDSGRRIFDNHQTMAKTVKLCKAIPNKVESDISFTTSDSHRTPGNEEFKAIRLNNNAKRRQGIIDTSAEAGESTIGNQNDQCIRIQYYPKNTFRSPVVNLSNRKPSSFTNLLVVERKDQQIEREATSGELVSCSCDPSTARSSEKQDVISIPTILSEDGDDELMLSAPSFYDTCNSASSISLLNGETNYLDYYDIDSLICDDVLVYQNTCNSAHRGETVRYGRGSMNHPTLVNDTDDDALYDANYGQPVTSRRRSLAKNISDHAVNSSEEPKIPECTGSAWNNESKSVKGKGKRKYPFDLQYDKIEEQKYHAIARLPSPNRQHPFKNNVKELSSSKPKTKTFNVPYLQSGKTEGSSQPKGSSTLQLLHQNARVETPTILEPSKMEKPKFFASPSSYTPSNNFNSIASSVGEAIGAITSAFQSSFMSMVSPTKKGSSQTNLKQNSPRKAEVRPTSSSPGRAAPKQQAHTVSPKKIDYGPTKIVDKPMSATRTYVSSVFEEKGITSSVENGLSTLKSFIGRDKKISENDKNNFIKQDVKKGLDSNIPEATKVLDGKKSQVKTNLESPAVEKKQNIDDVISDLIKINSHSPDRKKRLQSTERGNKRINSPNSASLNDKPNEIKDIQRSENAAPKKNSMQGDKNNVKSQITAATAIDSKQSSKTVEVIKTDKNLTDKLKMQTSASPEKTVSVSTSPTKTEPVKIEKAATQLRKDTDIDQSGKNLFVPLIDIKIPAAPIKKNEVPAVKTSKRKRKTDPDFFSSNKSHLGEL